MGSDKLIQKSGDMDTLPHTGMLPDGGICLRSTYYPS